MTLTCNLVPRCGLLAALLPVWLFCVVKPSAFAAASFEQVKADYRPSDTLVLDRNGQELQRVRTDSAVRKGQWTALDDISPALRTALVQSEDKRFYEHSGVDWQAVSAAAWANLWNTKTRGASTITMQLAGLLDQDLQRGAGGRSLVQKIGQTASAQLLEVGWRKDQILEAYINLVPFRGELVGIDALSRTLFGKAPQGLDLREAAVAAALVRAPNAPAQHVTRRACSVLKALSPSQPTNQSTGSCDALDVYVQSALQRRDYAASQGIAPHAAQQLLRNQPADPAGAKGDKGSAAFKGSEIRSTLSGPLQRFAVQTLQQHLRELRSRQVEDGAVLVLDNASGEVLAWVGSSGELSSAAQVDGVTALRQPGSTLKPFLYAQAIAERRITAATLLDDSSAQLQTPGGLYIPQNYDRQFKGWVSVRTALGASLNVPAVRTLAMVSPDAFYRQLVRLGLSIKESGDYYGYSLALGSAEVSLMSLTNAYRVLANGGRFSPITLAAVSANERPLRSTQALDPGAVFIIGDILSDTNARARAFGTDSILATRFWSAVKTGTSKDMRDNWAVGYSQRYTVGVWVGNASGAPMWDVSGTTGAAPVWAAVMAYLHQSSPSHSPAAPAGVVRTGVEFALATADGYAEAARQEWFLQGTQQSHFAQKPDALTRITAPASGTIVALDPDIPPRHQRLTFTARGGTGLRWVMDGKEFARGASAHWLPWPGRHVVQLRNENGEILDAIRIEVRGAGVLKVVGGGANQVIP